jgi:hypothetical protein
MQNEKKVNSPLILHDAMARTELVNPVGDK